MDITHFYKERGQGQPLVLLHGNGENCDYFQNQMEALAAHYHIYALDTRGHGKTPRGSAPFTIRQFADDLLGFMDEHRIEKAHLLGFSDGGNIAMVFALQHPERLERLVLNGANLDASGVKRTVQLPIELGYRIAKLRASKSSAARQRAEMLGLMVNDPNIEPDTLQKVRAKTLVIAGTQDMIKDAHTRLIAQSIPDSQLAIIDGDHFIAANNPTEFNRVVLDFLEG